MAVDATATLNVHTIAIRVPIRKLTRDGSAPSDPMSAEGRARGLGRREPAQDAGDRPGEAASASESGPWVQVSRLGNPLFNEVVVPLGEKDYWNALHAGRRTRSSRSTWSARSSRSSCRCCTRACSRSWPRYTKTRADLVAILLTGIPKGIVAGFQNNTGSTLADMLRLNVAIPPTTSNPNALGLLGGDAAGFPNGRRVFDDIVNIELRAIAGAHLSAGRPELHARRRGVAGDPGADAGAGPLPGDVPVPRARRTTATARGSRHERRDCHAAAERHEHHHPAYAERAHPEHVAIDIGGGLGALIVHAGAEMHGVEVEISRAGEERTGAHKQVLERKIAGRAAFTLLYDGLPAGRYTLWVGEEAARPRRRDQGRPRSPSWTGGTDDSRSDIGPRARDQVRRPGRPRCIVEIRDAGDAGSSLGRPGAPSASDCRGSL